MTAREGLSADTGRRYSLVRAPEVNQPFFIVGPTAVGKSDLAAAVAQRCRGEIVSVDAFQIYRGLDLLTAKPDASALHAVRHHLISSVEPSTEMNAEQFRLRAAEAIEEIQSRGKPAFVVGGSGMYVKALTHGLSPLPPANAHLRKQLEQCSERELLVRLALRDPVSAQTIDPQNKRRLIRALEICLLTGRPVSEQRLRDEPVRAPAGVFVFRDRADLYERIDSRVKMMFANGVVDEVRRVGEPGTTAAKALGFEQIQGFIRGEISEAACIAAIQQVTRRYAKRQLTWFQRQTSFEPLNLSLHGPSDAIELISRKARMSFAQENV